MVRWKLALKLSSWRDFGWSGNVEIFIHMEELSLTYVVYMQTLVWSVTSKCFMWGVHLWGGPSGILGQAKVWAKSTKAQGFGFGSLDLGRLDGPTDLDQARARPGSAWCTYNFLEHEVSKYCKMTLEFQYITFKYLACAYIVVVTIGQLCYCSNRPSPPFRSNCCCNCLYIRAFTSLCFYTENYKHII